MRRLRVFAGWFALLIAAILIATLIVTVQSSIRDRREALMVAERALDNQRREGRRFQRDREELKQQTDRLNRRVSLLLNLTREQSEAIVELNRELNNLRRQVINLGGTPSTTTIVVPESRSTTSDPPPDTSDPEPPPEPEPEPEPTEVPPSEKVCKQKNPPPRCR